MFAGLLWSVDEPGTIARTGRDVAPLRIPVDLPACSRDSVPVSLYWAAVVCGNPDAAPAKFRVVPKIGSYSHRAADDAYRSAIPTLNVKSA